jgi:threonine aldolase
MLAKGRLIGLQFDVLFTDGLYFAVSGNAMDRAQEMEAVFAEYGYTFHMPLVSNQIFVILTDGQRAALSRHLRSCFWERLDENRVVVRLAASWATTKEEVAQLRQILQQVKEEEIC